MLKYLLSAGALALFATLAHSAEATSYTKDIKPFVEKYCVECHNSKQAKSGVNLETLDAMLKRGRRGTAVVSPGKPEQSKLYLTLSGGAKQMPPRRSAQKPTGEEIAMVKAWIADGAKDTTPGKKADATAEAKTDARPTDAAPTPRRREGEREERRERERERERRREKESDR